MAGEAIVDERNSTWRDAGGVGRSRRTPVLPRFRFVTRSSARAWRRPRAIPPMDTPFRQAEAIIWFGARDGCRTPRQGACGAAGACAALSTLHADLAAAGDPYWAEQVGIQETAVSAWIALADNDVDRAVGLMRNAADREDRSEKHVAMENRLSPMRELLGELLLEAARPADALREFERSLITVPNRFRSLAGAAAGADRIANRGSATSYYRQLVALAANADGERPALAAARAYLAAQ